MFAPGTVLPWDFTPLAALARWPADRPVLLLHSGRFHPRWARWSVLAQPVGVLQFQTPPAGGPRAGQTQWLGPLPACPLPRLTHEPLTDLRCALQQGQGLWIGYLGYDLARWIERLPPTAGADRHWPIFALGFCPRYLLYDHALGQWSACGAWAGHNPAAWLPGAVTPGVESAKPRDNHAWDSGGLPIGVLQSDFTAETYQHAVARVLDYIAAGDVFQVNLAQRFTAAVAGPYPAAARALYARLAAVSPAWYGAYLEWPGDPRNPAAPRRVIASTSPELFLEVDPTGRVLTRPIKGTLPAGADPLRLAASAKDAAELHMIVDLMRNDLGRVCAYGSIAVTEARGIETHPTVHHGVATIEGRLHARRDLTDLLRATLPGGSVTGAPKVRAMQIIDELEPVRRGPYCGCIGALTHNSTCLNIAIRSLLLEFDPAPAGAPAPGRVDFSVGGGIVADSNPRAEYDETLDKAAALCAALGLSRPHIP
jgi:para-aminobenzoate synthetase component 1